MAVVVDADLEEGDFSDFDSYISDADLQVSALGALGQTSYGIRVVIDDTDNLYAQANFTPGASYFRARIYFDPNTLSMATSDTFSFMLFGGDSGALVQCDLNWSGSAYRVRFRSREDDLSATQTFVVITDVEHYVEVLATRGAGTGEHQMWIDGVSSATHSSLDNDTIFDDVTNVKVGVLYLTSSGTTGNFYVDELVVRNDNTQIGPNATTTSTTTTGGTTTTGASTTTLSGSGSTSTVTVSGTTGTTTTTTTTTGTTTTAGTTTSAAGTTIKLRDGPGGHTARAAIGDYLVLRNLDTGGTLRETWVEVSNVTDPGGGATYYEYAINRMSGDAVQFEEGTTVVNYGSASDSVIRVIGEE